MLLIQSNIANQQETPGLWMHASTNTEVEFFGSRFSCLTGDEWGPGDGDAVWFKTQLSKTTAGSWCNRDTTSLQRYICKAKMSNDNQ